VVAYTKKASDGWRNKGAIATEDGAEGRDVNVEIDSDWQSLTTLWKLEQRRRAGRQKPEVRERRKLVI
jgi:hypothetical protein